MGERNFLHMEARTSIWEDSLRLARDYPLTGTGMGTFGTAFRGYQTGVVNNYVDHPHCDYIELMSETGLVSVTMILVSILYLLVRMVISFLGDSHGYRRSVVLGCIGSSLALLIRGFTDFNLQIPANALILGIVLGIGEKAACVEPREETAVVATQWMRGQFHPPKSDCHDVFIVHQGLRLGGAPLEKDTQSPHGRPNLAACS